MFGITSFAETPFADGNSEVVVVTVTGSVSLAGVAPVLNRDVIPAGGAKISGSAPVIVSTEFRIRPGTSAIVATGETSKTIINFVAPPAANDAVIVGFVPNVEQSAVLTPQTGTVTLDGVASKLGVVITVGSKALNVVGHVPKQNFGIVPDSGGLVTEGIASRLGLTIEPSEGAVTLAGDAPELIAGQVRIPGTEELSAVGATPWLDSGIFAQSGAVNVVGHAPEASQGTVLTPTGGAVIVGSAPVVVVRGSVLKPFTGALNLVGQVPTTVRTRVITPSVGKLIIGGLKPTVDNPNWSNIDDNQAPNWSAINNSQTPNWTDVSGSQDPNWQPIAA